MPIGDEWRQYGTFNRRELAESPRERQLERAFDGMYGDGYWEATRAERAERDAANRQRVIDHVAAELRRRVNGIIGSPVNPNTMAAVQREVLDALNGLRSQGIEDLNIEVVQNPNDPHGLILNISHRGLERRDAVNNSFGESPISAVLGAVAATHVALEQSNRALFADLMIPGRQQIQISAQEARVNVEGLRQLFAELSPEDKKRVTRTILEAQVAEEIDTTNNFTPQRKLEID